jgi:uncharacterized protein YjiS (DUF1127 family)
MTLTLRQSQPETDRRNHALDSLELLTRAIKVIDIWRQREKSRASFYGLDSKILRDAGISETQRFIEGNKPFWEA